MLVSHALLCSPCTRKETMRNAPLSKPVSGSRPARRRQNPLSVRRATSGGSSRVPARAELEHASRGPDRMATNDRIGADLSGASSGSRNVAAPATTVRLLVLRPAGSKEKPWPPHVLRRRFSWLVRTEHSRSLGALSALFGRQEKRSTPIPVSGWSGPFAPDAWGELDRAAALGVSVCDRLRPRRP
jgi:hypothetical protein